MASHIFDAVVAGHICLDITPDLSATALTSADEFFIPGKLINCGAPTLSTGGAVNNTGLAMVRMGIKTALMGKVGEDPFGRIVQTILAKQGVTEGLIIHKGATTSYSVVLAPGRMDRMFLHHPGANDTFCADDIDYELVSQSRLFHLGYPPLMKALFKNDCRQCIDIYRRIRQANVTTCLDMALSDPDSPSGKVNWAKMLKALGEYLDIFLPSAEELLYILNRPRFDELRRVNPHDIISQLTGDDLHLLSQRLLDWGIKIVGIKCGLRGWYVRTAAEASLLRAGKAAPVNPANWAGRELWQPVYFVENPVSATGAGDNSIAGFLSALLRGLSIEQALAAAVAAGACNVTAADALSGLVPWDQMTAKIQAGWKTSTLTVSGSGWRKDGNIWKGPGETT